MICFSTRDLSAKERSYFLNQASDLIFLLSHFIFACEVLRIFSGFGFVNIFGRLAFWKLYIVGLLLTNVELGSGRCSD